LFFLLEELLRIFFYHVLEEPQEPSLQPFTSALPPQIEKSTIESSTAKLPPFAEESEPTMSNLIIFVLVQRPDLTWRCSSVGGFHMVFNLGFSIIVLKHIHKVFNHRAQNA